MFIKVLVLGRPGSGKTTAFRRISTLMENRDWSVTRIRDYEILQRMFERDVEEKKFHQAEYGGFDIIDFSVLDSALIEVESQVRLHMLSAKENALFVIECARSDYKEELKPFSSSFLQGAHILFINADVETCIHRIHQRVLDNTAFDNHFVSDHIVRGYYGYDNRPYMEYLTELSAKASKQGNGIDGVVQTIENTGSLSDFYAAVDDFFVALLIQERTSVNKRLPGSGKRNVLLANVL